MNASEVITELALATKEQMAAVIAPLLERIAVLESKASVPIDLDLVASKAMRLVPTPADGRDAPPVDVDAIAIQAAALIPVPRDGRDGERGQDGQEGKAGPAGKDAPQVDLSEVAIKAAKLVPVPKDGRDAPTVDIDAIAIKAAQLVPAPKDGRDGKDADSALIESLRAEVLSLKSTLVSLPRIVDVEAKVATAVDLAVKSLPAPKDGERGQDGKDGRDVDAALLQTIVAASVERVLAEWPKPQDGKSLTPQDVAPLIKAEVAAATADIRSGSDGVGITTALIDQDGCLQLTKSDGSTQPCGRVVGAPGRDADMALLQKQIADEIALIPKPKDGKDGERGADGLGFDDLDGVLDAEKGFLLRFSRGEHVKEFGIPTLIDRGVYRPGTLYLKGSTVTAQGSLWIAQADTREKPGDGATSWRLAVKKGRDGRDLTERRDG